MRVNRQRSGGFTFAEMIAASAVMVVLASTLGATTVALINYNKTQITKARLLETQDAILRFYSDNGIAPGGLVDLLQDPGSGAQWKNWQGPYLSRSHTDALNDAWGHPYTYQTCPNSGNPPPSCNAGNMLSSTPLVLLISNGKNGVLDTNPASQWWNSVWAPAGDDLTLEFPLRITSLDPIDITRNELDIGRARILVDNPTKAPNNWGVSSYVDAWGNKIQYNKCSDGLAFLYSYGPNQVDDSNKGNNLCNDPPIMGDDIVDAIVWEIRHDPATPSWTGGLDVQPTHCASYTLTVTNLYLQGATVVVRQNGNTIATINDGLIATLTVGWQDVQLTRGSLLLDDFRPDSADLNQNCTVSKTVGIQPPPVP